jgi:hypothetical protein
MIRLKERDYKHIVQRILCIMQEYRCLRKNTVQCEEIEHLAEENTFYIFRTDTQTVLAKGIIGYEAAKERANRFRKAMNLRWDQIQFKAERQTPTPKRFGVSADGRNYTNARGETGRVDYAKNYNSSKGRRFRGAYDKDGNFADID